MLTNIEANSFPLTFIPSSNPASFIPSLDREVDRSFGCKVGLDEGGIGLDEGMVGLEDRTGLIGKIGLAEETIGLEETETGLG